MKQFALCLIFCSLLLGCKKEDDGSKTTAPSKTDFLVKSAWLIKTKQYRKQSETVWTDATGQIDIYAKDDNLIFRKDGTYEINEGATRYHPTDPFIYETGIWKFAQNETLLIITKTGGSQKDMTIEVLDANTLTISYAELRLGTTYIIKQTYSH